MVEAEHLAEAFRAANRSSGHRIWCLRLDEPVPDALVVPLLVVVGGVLPVLLQEEAEFPDKEIPWLRLGD